MQTPLIFLLISLVYVVHVGGKYQSSNCQRLENKIYFLTVTFPDLNPFYAILRLLPNGLFDEVFSITNGNNTAELEENFSLSKLDGYYKCLKKTHLRLTGLGFLYKTADVSFLEENGGMIVHDYYFKFSENDQNLNGSVKFGVWKSGTNVFTTSDEPVFEGKVGNVTGELVRYKRKYDLSDS